MITWEGTEYPLDVTFDKVTHEEWLQIKDKLHLTIRQFIEGVEQLDPDAITAVYWLMMRSDGAHDALVLKRSMGFDDMKFMSAYADGALAQAKESEAEADPTTGGSLPAGETPATTATTASATSATSGTASTKATSDVLPASTSLHLPATATSDLVISPDSP